MSPHFDTRPALRLRQQRRAEALARQDHLHCRFSHRDGWLLLELLLVIAINGGGQNRNKRQIKTEIASTFKVAPEMVDTRIRDLVEIGYAVTTPGEDGRATIVIATPDAYAAVDAYDAAMRETLRTYMITGTPAPRETEVVRPIA